MKSPEEVIAEAEKLQATTKRTYTFVKTSPDGKEIAYVNDLKKVSVWSTKWFKEQLKAGNVVANDDNTICFAAVEKDRSWL